MGEQVFWRTKNLGGPEGFSGVNQRGRYPRQREQWGLGLLKNSLGLPRVWGLECRAVGAFREPQSIFLICFQE